MTGESDTGGAIEAIGGARTMGATIRVLRRRYGISQVALAARADTHHNYLGAVERGAMRNPGLALLTRIAHGLGLSVTELTDGFTHTGQLPISPGAARWPVTGAPAVATGYGPDALAETLRILRRQRNLTQGDLAEAAGTHRSYLSSLEAGEKPSPGIRTVAKLAYGLAAEPNDAPTLLAHLAQVFAGEIDISRFHAREAARQAPDPPGHPSPGNGPAP